MHVLVHVDCAIRAGQCFPGAVAAWLLGIQHDGRDWLQFLVVVGRPVNVGIWRFRRAVACTFKTEQVICVTATLVVADACRGR